MSYSNAQDLLHAAVDAHRGFVARLTPPKPNDNGSLEAIRASHLSERHQRVAETLNNLLAGDYKPQEGDPSAWVQYDLNLDHKAFDPKTEPFQSCDEAVAASIELSRYFSQLFEVAARQVSAPTHKAVLSDLANLEKEIGKEASWAQQQNTDIASE